MPWKKREQKSIATSAESVTKEISKPEKRYGPTIIAAEEYAKRSIGTGPRRVDDWSGKAKAILTKDNQTIIPGPRDIVSATNAPVIKATHLDTSRIEQVKSNAVKEQMNNAAATVKTSKALNKSLQTTAGESAAVMSSTVYNIMNSRNSRISNSSGGGGTSTPDRFWKDIDSILGGNVI